MPAHIRLTDDQLPFYEEVLNKAQIDYQNSGNLIGLTGENFYQILDALKAAHTKNFSIKTKTPDRVELLFHLERIINRVEAQAMYFPIDHETSSGNVFADLELPNPEELLENSKAIIENTTNNTNEENNS